MSTKTQYKLMRPQNWRRIFRGWQIKGLRTLYKLNAPTDLYLLFLASLVGVLTGFGAYLLNIIVDAVHFLLFEQAGFSIFTSGLSNYLRIIYPAIGGLAVGLLAYYFSPEVKGHGIPSVMDAVANKGGYIRKRVAVLTSINSGTTIGSGGSAGKEGPIVQIGAAIGSSIGQFFHVSQKRLKVLVGCGSAAGLAAVFNAPVAGVLFSIEIILGDYSLGVFTPIVISSVIATAISRSLIGSSPIFMIPEYSLQSPAEYPLYLLMGLLGGVLAVIFIKTLYGIEDLFEEKLNLPAYVKPAIGGLLTGLVAYKFPVLYGFDDSATHTALMGRTEIPILAILIIAKILATSFTLGSGGTGGLFTPSLFIGAMYGAFFGAIVNQLFPSITAPPGAYALVGMGVIVSGTIHAPLTALLMIFEVTTDYKIILPLMIGTVASVLVARALERESIYTMKVSLFSSRTAGGKNIDILKTHKITNLVLEDVPVIYEYTPFDEILNIFMESHYTTLPVLDKTNRVTGTISLRDLRPVLFDRHVAPLLLATDIMSENIFVLEKNNTLEEALQKMEIDDSDLLPVVESTKNMRYLGMVAREDIWRRYSKESLLLTDNRD
ncbi:MAG: chloride channel protein [Calditrichaeota bacterium]|nr:chloride channel protein [Calditrichota bacterium]